MPELPEVETVRRGLNGLILGRAIAGLQVYKPKSCPVDPLILAEEIVGSTIVAIRRFAKLLSIDLSTDWSLAVHLKMTGQLVFRDDLDADENWAGGHPTLSFLAHLPDRSTRVVIDLTEPGRVGSPTSHLFFNDQRIFGWIKPMPSPDVERLDFVATLGPEPLTPDGERLEGTPARSAATGYLARVRRHPAMVVKAAILDQTVIAGVGNIYADEALWSAKIHPSTRIRDLSDNQLRKIFREAGEAMMRSLAAGGSTMSTYIQPDGTPGSYLDQFANVFRREGEPCPRCGTAIEKIRVAGRGTHLCPRCQTVIA